MSTIQQVPAHLEAALTNTSIDLIDIMHGELKNLMYECETKLSSMGNHDLPDKFYHEGYMDCLTDLYQMTYNLSFWREDKTNGK
jgi:hypothetical protein